MPGVIVDGQDVDAVTRRSSAAVARARAGDGPTLIETKTYRYRGHSRTDPAKYRAEGELERWKERDPIDLLGGQARAEAVGEDAAARRCTREVQAEVDAAADARRARRRSRPSRRSRPMSTQLETEPSRDAGDVAELTYREAVNAALEDELAADPTVLLHGRGRRHRRRRLQDERGLCRRSSAASGSATRRSARTASSASRSGWR